jgi:very-short-patch-repair endonuclease
MLPYNKGLKLLSRKLRSQMTDAETALWSKLRRKQLHNLQFYRQKPLGRFIVDFYCPTARLVIEIAEVNTTLKREWPLIPTGTPS